jgi:hypothetical protein
MKILSRIVFPEILLWDHHKRRKARKARQD